MPIGTCLPYLAASVEGSDAIATKTPVGLTRSPELGAGWMRVARRVAEIVPPAEIQGIWLFAPVRREELEWGTAVVLRRAEDNRRRVYTASYLLVVRGRERGQGKVTVEEVGVGPARVVHDVIAGVQHRAGEPHPPTEIARALWFGEHHDESPTES